jgi:hypothetical protein
MRRSAERLLSVLVDEAVFTKSLERLEVCRIQLVQQALRRMREYVAHCTEWDEVQKQKSTSDGTAAG